MSNLSFFDIVCVWILATVAIYVSGFIYQRFWRYFYRRRGWQTELQTERGDKDESRRTLLIAWGSGFVVACLIIRGIWQFEPFHKGLVIFGGPIAILTCGFLGLSVPEVWVIWRKHHHQ